MGNEPKQLDRPSSFLPNWVVRCLFCLSWTIVAISFRLWQSAPWMTYVSTSCSKQLTYWLSLKVSTLNTSKIFFSKWMFLFLHMAGWTFLIFGPPYLTQERKSCWSVVVYKRALSNGHREWIQVWSSERIPFFVKLPIGRSFLFRDRNHHNGQASWSW